MDHSVFRRVREALFGCFCHARPAMMNLMDALLTEPQAQSVAELSLSPRFDQQWPSLYQALEDGRLSHTAVRDLYCAELPAAYLPTPGSTERLLLAADATSILRALSRTARDRSYVHAPVDATDAKPIGVGWQYAALVALPSLPSSWTYYLALTRIPTRHTAGEIAAAQLASILERLPDRPVLVADRYYGSATFVTLVQPLACDFLLRLQSHRTFYAAPPPPTGKPGAPRKRGDKFKCNDTTTHGTPTDAWHGVDQQGRAVTVTAWAGMHFSELLTVPVTILRVTRQDSKGTRRDPREIWLCWVGDTPPPLAQIADWYTRRFSIEHGFRFDKQSLLWTAPRLRTPGRFSLWTDLIGMTHNLLVLARDTVGGLRLPWQQGTKTALTPQHVRRALAGILGRLGTPAPAAQPRGKSPGWITGRARTPAKKYHIVKKSPAVAAPTAAALPLLA